MFTGDLPFDPAFAWAGWGPPCAVGGCQGRALGRAALAGPKMGLGPRLQVSLTHSTDEHGKMRRNSSFIRGPRARGAHTKSQHYRAMRSAGFAWGGVGGQMERPLAWTKLGLRWTARSRLNLPTPHYLPPTTASTIWCGTATSAIAAGKQGPQTTRGPAKVGSHPSCPRQR